MASVLIVAPSSPERTLAYRTLLYQRHDVTTASDGAEALHKLEREGFQAVLLDTGVPDATGWLRRLRAVTGRTRTVFVALVPSGDEAAAARAAEAGAVEQIRKPFGAENLCRSVEDAIARAGNAARRVIQLEERAELYRAVIDLQRLARSLT